MARNNIKVLLRREWPFHLLLLPCVIVIFIYNYVPIYGIIIAFQKYNVARGFSSPWVGLANFRFVFSQAQFIRTIWNTLYIAFFKIMLGVAVPVIFALLLNEVSSVPLKRIFQTLIYVPYFLSWVIMAGVLIDILSFDGIINLAISALGREPVPFLIDPKIFPWTMIISDIWKNFGFGTIVYLAAITGIDPELYESALVDGAGRWKQTIFITLPLMVPIIALMLVLSLGGILNAGFDQIYNLYSPAVLSTADIIDTFVFRLGIQQAQYSIAAAVGLFKSFGGAILTLFSLNLAYRFAGYRVY
jgi:putative aldouronate transport system permease protein